VTYIFSLPYRKVNMTLSLSLAMCCRTNCLVAWSFFASA